MVKRNVLKEFRNGIDGLDIAAIIGMDQNRGLGDVYLDKMRSQFYLLIIC